MKHLDDDTALVCIGCRSILKARLEIDILAEPKEALPTRKSPPSVERSGSLAERSIPPAAERSIPPPALERSLPPERLSREETSQNGVVSSTGDPRKVVVAIDGEGTKELVREILASASFNMIEANSGKEILSLLNRHHPAVALIDIGLPDGLGSDFCNLIKKDSRLKGTIVILLASIYDKNNKYRREPSSLFGADDYIERHNVEKDLLVQIKKHLNRMGGRPILATAEPLEMEPTADPLMEKETSFTPSKPAIEDRESTFDLEQTSDSVTEESFSPPPVEAPPPVKEPKEVEDARRLARIIVSDIVLYNKKKVEEGLRSDRFFELLKEEIEEGRKHYHSRVAEELERRDDFYKEAFDDFILKKKGAPS